MAHGTGGGSHQIEVIPAEPGTTRVRVLRGDVELAHSGRPSLLRETGYPDCYYLPPEDVRTQLLTATSLTTHCPFKGDASYWAVRDGEGTEVVWAYPDPKPQVAVIKDHLCFDEGADGVRVEVTTG